MDELITRLRAQLDEDERVARETVGHGSTTWRAGLHRWRGRIEVDDAALIVRDVDLVDAEHIARWDPARVLAEVEAKRRILDRHARVLERGNWEWFAGSESESEWHVKVLAQPYAGSPGWREQWRLTPDGDTPGNAG